MQYAELKNSILKARQTRWDNLMLLTEKCRSGCIVTVAGNAAGAVKDSPVLRELITFAERKITKSAEALTIGAYCDSAGYIVFMHSPLMPAAAKKAAVAIETENEWNRLLDIDIYGVDGQPADRKKMGFPPRKCLICGEPAAGCIRTQRHEYGDIIAETDRLLKGFQRFCSGSH